MPTENDIPPQYRRVRISTIDDDELLNKLAELEKTTKEEMEAMREEIRSLKALIHKLVDDQGVVVSSRPTPKKRRLVQISEADDDDSEDMMIPHMPVMQNGPIPSQSPLDDDDNEKEDAGHEEEQDDNDNVNDNDNNDGDAVGDAGKEVVEDDNDQEMQEEYQPPNSYGEELFDESEEISIEKTSSYPGISTSDLPSSFFISPQPQQPQQQQQPEPQQQQSEQQQQQPEPQQQQPEPQQQQPEPQQQQPEPQQQQPEPQQQQQQPKQQQPEPQQQQQQPKQQQSEQQQQQPEQQQQQQQPKQERPQYDLSSKLTTVNDVWIEWKVGDDCIEKQIERYGDEWCYNGDSSTFLKKQVLIQEIEYIVKKCETDDDYDTKCQKAIEALEARRKERGSLNRLCSLIKAFQNCAEQAVGFDGTGERDSYVSI